MVEGAPGDRGESAGAGAGALRRLYWRSLGAWRGAGRWLRRGRGVARDVAAQLELIALTARLAALPPAAPPAPRHAPGEPPNLLVISFYAPPYRSVFGTQRVAKFVKYLVRAGWRVTLLTSDPASDDEREGGAGPEADGATVVRLPGAGMRVTSGRRGRYVPDDHLHWTGAAVRAATGLARTQRFSAVLGTAPPYVNLLAAADVSARLGVPLVADLRDPWSRIDFGWRIERPLPRRLNAWMERTVLARAARIVIVVDGRFAADYLADASPGTRARTVSITNGYDEEDFAAAAAGAAAGARVRRERFTISYVGSLYDRETFAHVVGPLRRWQLAHPGDLAEVELVYAGANPGYFERHGPLPVALRCLGYLPHLDAIRARIDSDAQLFVLPPALAPHVYTGKVFEMLRAGVPIVAITRPDSAAAALVTRCGAGTACAGDDEAARALKALFDRWKAGLPPPVPDPAAVRAYSREALAGRLDRLLRELTGRAA